MSSFTTYTQRNAVGAILELEALIIAPTARVAALENPGLMAPIQEKVEEEENG